MQIDDAKEERNNPTESIQQGSVNDGHKGSRRAVARKPTDSVSDFNFVSEPARLFDKNRGAHAAPLAEKKILSAENGKQNREAHDATRCSEVFFALRPIALIDRVRKNILINPISQAPIGD